MNRRLPRIGLLVVLLVTMVGTLQGGGASFHLIQAQENPCDFYSTVDFEGQLSDPNRPASESREDFQIISAFTTLGGPNQPGAKALLDIEINPGGVLAIYSLEPTIIRIDGGSSAILTVCEGSSVMVQKAGEDEPHSVDSSNDGEPLEPGSAIFVEFGNLYYLTGLGNSEATPSGSLQQLDYELANNELPGANQPNQKVKITSGTGISYMLCGGAGCS